VASLRLVSVVLLVGMGATVAAVNGISKPGEPGRSAAVAGSISSDAMADNSIPNGSISSGVAGDGSAKGIYGALLAPGTSAQVGNGVPVDVRAENSLGGTSAWRISRTRGSKPGLDAYAGAVSVRSGELVPLAVSGLSGLSGQGSVRIRALRIGWYDGVGAREIWQGTLQARPEPAAPSQWQDRGWADTTGWPEGHYLLRLDQGDASRYVPLTVRSADAQGKILVLTSPLTWQAENNQVDTASNGSGASLESGAGLGSGDTSVEHTVSFDRPYAAGYGSGGFLANDAGIVQLAERSGKDLAYATDYDVARDPTLVTNAAAVLIGGDSRFWTSSLRTAIRDAGAAGTNLAFFGAGTGSRQVSLGADRRALAISAAEPSTSVRLTGLRPSCTGVGSANGGRSANGAGPATRSGADQSVSVGPGAPWTISDSDWWGFKGADVRTGDTLPGLVAGGADRASTSSPGSPTQMQVLSMSRFPCGPRKVSQSAVYQVRPSGAGVFVAGTGGWACATSDACTGTSGKPVKVDERARQVVVRVTRNVISAFAKAQAGDRYPARDSASLYASLR
jgi:hypothetical protein